MSGIARRIGSFLKQLISVVTLTLLMVPSAAYADLLLQLHDEWSSRPVPETPRQTAKKQAELCLNGNGDLLIGGSDVSLAMAYTPPVNIIEPKERLTVAPRLNCPSFSGISFKVSFQF